MIESPQNFDMEEDAWLRDLVDDDLRGLFQDECDSVAREIARLIERAAWDGDLQERLIEALSTAVHERNDDSYGSIWIALILGEAKSSDAVDVLLNALICDAEEELNEAASDALALIGLRGVEKVMEFLEEDPTEEGVRSALRVLEMAGDPKDESLRHGIIEFVRQRILIESRRPVSEPNFCGLFALAAARLGDRDARQLIQRILDERFGGAQPLLQETIDMFRENPSGVCLVGMPPTWRQRYQWYFGDEMARQKDSTEEDSTTLGALFQGVSAWNPLDEGESPELPVPEEDEPDPLTGESG